MTRHFRLFWSVAVVGLFLFSTSGYSAEISALTGVFKNESMKVEGEAGGGKSTFQVAGRYWEEYEPKLHWFGEGGVTVYSYSAAKNGTAPDNTVGIKLGGGMRYELDPFSHSVVPYGIGSMSYRSWKEAAITSTGHSSTQYTGIYYTGGIGVLFGFSKSIFAFLETQLFDSALYAVKTEEASVTAAGVTTKSKTSTTYVELFGSTGSAFDNTSVGIGMKL